MEGDILNDDIIEDDVSDDDHDILTSRPDQNLRGIQSHLSKNIVKVTSTSQMVRNSNGQIDSDIHPSLKSNSNSNSTLTPANTDTRATLSENTTNLTKNSPLIGKKKQSQFGKKKTGATNAPTIQLSFLNPSTPSSSSTALPINDERSAKISGPPKPASKEDQKTILENLQADAMSENTEFRRLERDNQFKKRVEKLKDKVNNSKHSTENGRTANKKEIEGFIAKYFKENYEPEYENFQLVKYKNRISTNKDSSEVHDASETRDVEITTPENKQVNSKSTPSTSVPRVCAVLDMDCFFCSAEQADKPHLAEVPFCVVDYGCICAANYEARKYGIGIGRFSIYNELARIQGIKLESANCDYAKYGRASVKVQRILRDEYGFCEEEGNIKVPSMDEMFLDLTLKCGGCFEKGAELMNEMRKAIKEKTNMTCSAGIGPNFLLAKVASNVNKPNGQFVVPYENGSSTLLMSKRSSTESNSSKNVIESILNKPQSHWLHSSDLNLPHGKIQGIGPTSQAILKAFEIHSVSDIFKNRSLVWTLFTPFSSQAQLLILASLGLPHKADFLSLRNLDNDRENFDKMKKHKQSLSQERTFGTNPATDYPRIEQRIRDLAKRLGEELEYEKLEFRTVTLKFLLFDSSATNHGRVAKSMGLGGTNTLNYVYSTKESEINRCGQELAKRFIKDIYFRKDLNWFESLENSAKGIHNLGIIVSNLRPQKSASPAVSNDDELKQGSDKKLQSDEKSVQNPAANQAEDLGRGNSSLCPRLWQMSPRRKGNENDAVFDNEWKVVADETEKSNAVGTGTASNGVGAKSVGLSHFLKRKSGTGKNAKKEAPSSKRAKIDFSNTNVLETKPAGDAMIVLSDSEGSSGEVLHDKSGKIESSSRETKEDPVADNQNSAVSEVIVSVDDDSSDDSLQIIENDENG